MTIWYTADTHFGHENVMTFCDRPFSSVEEMDAVLIENMCDRVHDDDDLWIIGDFAFGPRSKDASYLRSVFDRLPGARKHLIVGNHDREPTSSLPWDTVSPLVELRDGPIKQMNTLCHYPMITWNHARRGALKLFGHVHNNWLGSRNSVNVGVDVWDYAHVQFDDIVARTRDLPENQHWNDVEPK
ncbi:MAG: metallophosphoesterase [Pseudomonadota bacterium]